MSELRAWIRANLKPIKTINYKSSSYGIKHRAEIDLGRYVSEQELIKAMQQLGYKCKIWNPKYHKAYFNVSKGSMNKIYKRQEKARYVTV